MRIAYLLLAMMILSIPSFAQDASDGNTMKVIEGTISSVDWVGSVIVINDFRLIVASDVKIYKGNDLIDLGELNTGDAVTATYYDDPPGKHNAVSITVQYSGDWAV